MLLHLNRRPVEIVHELVASQTASVQKKKNVDPEMSGRM
jgi:hypothetical protein